MKRKGKLRKRDSKGEKEKGCYLQPPERKGKGRGGEPLICPVTGSGQLICWC